MTSELDTPACKKRFAQKLRHLLPAMPFDEVVEWASKTYVDTYVDASDLEPEEAAEIFSKPLPRRQKLVRQAIEASSSRCGPRSTATACTCAAASNDDYGGFALCLLTVHSRVRTSAVPVASDRTHMTANEGTLSS